MYDYIYKYGSYRFLGDTIEKIAGEKAGIIKEGVNVFSYMQAQGARKF